MIGCHHSLTPELPTMYNLPNERVEELGLSDEYHYLQPQLLSEPFSLVGYTHE
jgi:hypothetical protein